LDIAHVFDARLVLLDLKAQNAEAAIRELAGLLLEAGYVRETFADAVVAREMDFATGLQLKLLGAAIPHTYPTHVVMTGVAAARLAHPVTFGAMGSPGQTVSATLVLLLAVKDADSQVEMLQHIAELLRSEDAQGKLISAHTAEDVVAVLETREVHA